jgi:glucose-6-phosphate isomerase
VWTVTSAKPETHSDGIAITKILSICVGHVAWQTLVPENMSATNLEQWQQFKKFYRSYPTIDLAVDFSRMDLTDAFLNQMEAPMQKAFAAMSDLERGAIANSDENRMVGHYWLRNPQLAPTKEIAGEINSTNTRIKEFAQRVHSGEIRGSGGKFENLLLIGIGGSALGPQFVANALGGPKADKLRLFFFDNTDPDGMDKILEAIGGSLEKTICIVISKSGGTKETRNGMLEAENAYSKAGLDFKKHAVAVTMEGSELDRYSSGWAAKFPMWDWVGGRTSQLSAVGLLPAALQGINIDNLIAGANGVDTVTRSKSVLENPAALLALSWYSAGNGRGEKAMVILPYKDRLELFSKYLQQLVMESLGKELDCNGKKVNQGLTVFGNKGATDQHSYIQQLRDGPDNFFAVFVEVLRDRNDASLPVEPNTTSGDFLHAFFLGTRGALYEGGRKSITITIGSVSEFTVGTLIALFERAVGYYASLININAYHQPGVQAGKLAADQVIKLKGSIMKALSASKAPMSVEEIGAIIGGDADLVAIFKLCEHLAFNPDRKIKKIALADGLNAKYLCS